MSRPPRMGQRPSGGAWSGSGCSASNARPSASTRATMPLRGCRVRHGPVRVVDRGPTWIVMPGNSAATPSGRRPATWMRYTGGGTGSPTRGLGTPHRLHLVLAVEAANEIVACGSHEASIATGGWDVVTPGVNRSDDGIGEREVGDRAEQAGAERAAPQHEVGDAGLMERARRRQDATGHKPEHDPAGPSSSRR